MEAKPNKDYSYFELTEHNASQITIFILLVIIFIGLLFWIVLPVIKAFFEIFLQSEVYHLDGDLLPYSLENQNPKKETSYLFSWAIDTYQGALDESRYWFNPVLSSGFQITVLSLALSALITSVLPRKAGLLRQKIDREIAHAISKIAYAVYGAQTDAEQKEIVNQLRYADDRQLLHLVDEWNIKYQDLAALRRVVRWREMPFLQRAIRFNDGLQFYLKFYFTIKYSNTVLGFVYIGAGVLIIIIGLRGIKFIPPNQPSLVLFALGLEFTLLVIYAVSVMYSKQEGETEIEIEKSSDKEKSPYLDSEFSNSREVESLLRVFIASKSDKKK